MVVRQNRGRTYTHDLMSFANDTSWTDTLTDSTKGQNYCKSTHSTASEQ